MEYNYTKENPLRVVTLCSGYDSQCLALKYAGIPFELVAWAEFDPESKAPLDKQPAVIAHNALFPEYADRNLGDMTKIDWNTVPDFDMLFYSTPCFVAGTLVLTTNGYKRIEDVKAGDLVLTHTNEYKPVVTPMVKEYVGKMIHIKAMAHDGIDCTPEHPFLIRRRYREWNNGTRRWKRLFKEPEWVEAKDLSKDTYLGVAINQKSELPKWGGTILHYGGNNVESNGLEKLLDKELFWYLMGRYVGDGWTREDGTHYSVAVCCGGRNRDALVDAIRACGFKPTITKERGVERFTIYSKELVEFVRRFGKYAHGKRIDAETMSLPVALLERFLIGYEHSDGCKNGKYIQFSSVSKELAYGICQCIAKVYHRPYKIYRCDMPNKTVIEGRVVNQRDFYMFSFKEECKQDQAFYEDGYIWFPISEVSSYEWHGLVYNMEVETDNSYTANGTIVHNCQSISNAGLQHGFVEGSGTRSSIIWNVRDAVKIKRPKYLILENVKAMISDKFVGMFNLWQEELLKFGYTNFPQVLNSRDYGVPQNRERIFLVSIHGDAWFNFPQPQELKLRLKDVLEENVDEKYYLDDVKVATFVGGLEKDKLKMICSD